MPPILMSPFGIAGPMMLCLALVSPETRRYYFRQVWAMDKWFRDRLDRI